MTFDAFMRTQPPPLGGTVGNLAYVRNRFPTLALAFGLDPPLEEKWFVCEHCGNSMKKEYLVWHINAKYVTPTLPSRCESLALMLV